MIKFSANWCNFSKETINHAVRNTTLVWRSHCGTCDMCSVYLDIVLVVQELTLADALTSLRVSLFLFLYFTGLSSNSFEDLCFSAIFAFASATLSSIGECNFRLAIHNLVILSVSDWPIERRQHHCRLLCCSSVSDYTSLVAGYPPVTSKCFISHPLGWNNNAFLGRNSSSCGKSLWSLYSRYCATQFTLDMQFCRIGCFKSYTWPNSGYGW